MKLSWKGCFYAIASGVFFGVIPILILSVTRSGSASSAFCIMMRMAFAAVLLLPFTIRRIKAHPISRSTVKDMLIAALLMSCTSILLYTAYQFIPSGIGITLHYTYPLVILLLNVLLFHNRFSRVTMWAMAVSLLGVILLCDTSILPSNAWVGISLALCSSATFTAYFLWLEKRRLGELDPLLFAEILTTFNTCFLLCYVLLTAQTKVTFSLGMAVSLGLTGVAAILAVTTQALAIKHIGSVYTSILGTLEPIVCALGSALVLHDQISVRTVGGRRSSSFTARPLRPKVSKYSPGRRKANQTSPRHISVRARQV